MSAWVNDDNAPLLVDLYELTMLQAYWREGLRGEAVFSLYFRQLPAGRNYMLACGQQDALRFIHGLRFTAPVLDRLAGLSLFREDFLRWLADFRFTGEVRAMPEGTPVFPEEPIMEVTAPVAQAQLLETFLMNQVHLQTVLASKARRMVDAAGGRAVVDFGLRRMHGTDAGMKGARAYHIAGLAGTSNVLAGSVYGIPVRGTMAHSFIQAHDDEAAAFRAFAELYPGTTLLVDTYDSLAGVDKLIALKRELGGNFEFGAIRLDSGDLAGLARAARRKLDAAGLETVKILVSGGLDEFRIAELVESGAPIDGFGVGTSLGTSADAPNLDLVYKLTEYAGSGRIKLSPGKVILPGRKQVFRLEEGGRARRDVVAAQDERQAGRPLLEPVMREGEPLVPLEGGLEEARRRAAAEMERLPGSLRRPAPAPQAYPVAISARLRAARDRLTG